MSRVATSGSALGRRARLGTYSGAEADADRIGVFLARRARWGGGGYWTENEIVIM